MSGKVGCKVGDVLLWEDEKFHRHRMWKVEGVYLGCEGQESLVELRSLFEMPGVPLGRTGNAQTTFVPEVLTRNLVKYRPVTD